MTRIIQQFKSKKNSVYLVEEQGKLLIKKVYCDGLSFDNERRELPLLEGLRVPQIVRQEKNTLYLSYIEGKLLLDEFLDKPIEEMPRLANCLADFLLSYFKRRGKCLSDLNFRNFVINDFCYGIDFEESSQGELTECAAKAAAFCFLYDTQPDKKTAFCRSLFGRMGVVAFTAATKAYIKMLCERRGIAFDEEAVSDFLGSIKRI